MADKRTAAGKSHVKKETMYIAICITFVIGFLAGIIFSVYKSETIYQPASNTRQSASDQNNADLTALEKKAALDPQNVQILIDLGHHYFDADNFQKAIKTYSKVLEIQPANADIWTDLGVMYRRSKQPRKAIAAFDQAIKNDKLHEVSRFNKGIVLYYDLHDHKNAIKAWQDLLSVNPDAKAPNGLPIAEFIKEIEKSGH